MVRVSGPLRVVTDRPLLVSRVRVRAARDRAERGGLTAAFSDTVTVQGGQLTMEVLPGPAVLDVAVTGGHSHVVRLVVPDVASATLEQCVLAAEIAGEADKRTLERLAGEVAADRDEVRRLAEEAAGSAASAATSAGAASGSDAAAARSATAAGQSASQAATSATNAKTSETRAGQSATAASGSAQSARRDAERAATIAGSTRFDGDRLIINDVTSQPLTGPQGEPGLVYRGNYSSSTQYAAGDVVYYSGASYVALEDVQGVTPSPSRPQWGLLSARGATGQKGDPGDKGDKGDKGDRGPAGASAWADITGKPELATKTDLDLLGAQIAAKPSGKPVEVMPPTTTYNAALLWLRDKLVEYGTRFDRVVELPFDIDSSKATNMGYMFYGCSSLVSVPPMNTSNVTTMSSMFQDCSSLVSVPPMNTSNVTAMDYMFMRCSSLVSVPPMNTSQVTTMIYMFQDCPSLYKVGVGGLIRTDGTIPARRSSMTTGSGLTRQPFITPDGTPI